MNEFKDLSKLKEEYKKIDMSMTKRLVNVPKALWDAEIAPILWKNNIEIPTEQKHLDFAHLFHSLTPNSQRKLIYVCFHESDYKFKMKFIATMLKDYWGIIIVRENDGYIFDVVEGMVEKARKFLRFITNTKPSNKTADVVESKPVNK